jgi:hypothetical protein
MCRDHALDHVAFDISWDEVAKWVVKDEETVKAWGDLINRHSTRFLFGTDVVAPKSQDRHATADVVSHRFRKQKTIRKLARWALLNAENRAAHRHAASLPRPQQPSCIRA